MDLNQNVLDMKNVVLTELIKNDLSEDGIMDIGNSFIPPCDNDIMKISLEFDCWLKEIVGDTTVIDFLRGKVSNFFNGEAYRFYIKTKETLDEIENYFEYRQEILEGLFEDTDGPTQREKDKEIEKFIAYIREVFPENNSEIIKKYKDEFDKFFIMLV